MGSDKTKRNKKKCQIFQGFKGLQLGFPGSEKKHEKFKVFKGFFKGGKKFKGFSRFSRFSRAGGHTLACHKLLLWDWKSPIGNAEKQLTE